MTKYVYDPETLMYEPKDEPRLHKIVRRILLGLLGVGLALLYLWLYVGVFKLELPKTAILKRQNAGWETRMAVLNHRLELCDNTLSAIEDRDNFVYRSLYGLNEIPGNIRTAVYSSDAVDPAVRMLDVLMKRTEVESRSLDEISVVARQSGDMIACVPMVSPLLPDLRKVRLTSSFGYRSDPVYGGGEYHTGQDMATDRDTPVYAPGDAVVASCEYRFNGYGNEIVLDHGFGYQTRYAHLASTDVVVGMKVVRGEKIGTVGTTGKSTGPHLHYEVMYKGERVDPMAFMDMNMPLDEYRAMIARAASETVKDKKRSTSELLERRK